LLAYKDMNRTLKKIAALIPCYNEEKTIAYIFIDFRKTVILPIASGPIDIQKYFGKRIIDLDTGAIMIAV
jgi:hypothetical protein